MTERAVLAADIGGTTSKVVVATTDRIVSYAQGRGGNIRSDHNAYDNIVEAMAEALASADVEICAAHVGIAGAGPARWADINAVMQERWTLSAPLTVSSDLETAFVASVPGGTGTLVLAGTGAVSVRFEQGHNVARCDGMGWILGDIGSGTWFGLEALRAVAAHLDGRGPATVLTDTLADERGSGSDPRQALIAMIDGMQPAEFGRFAPRVLAHRDDPVCADIIDRGAAGIVRSALAVLDRDNPVVLTGGMLSEDRPLRPIVEQRLKAEVPGMEIAGSFPPILGAMRLALASAGIPCGTGMAEQIRTVTPFT